ncbi:phosphoglycolate phosphatase, partial [Burkholderia thailandensis]|nr:phosphoglycolate phosphatase [Burkholderia thailandensis]
MTTSLSPTRAAPDEPGLQRFDAVLFDLDGTLADTAPDLAAAVNKMQRARGLAETPLDTLL